LFAADGREVAWLQERSQGLALWRRFIELVPYIGGYLGLLPIPYHFTIYEGENYRGPGVPSQSTRQIGSYNRRLGFFDNYDLDMTGDAERIVDRRLCIAMAVALDALQQR
jgi:hypothetical protein